MDAVTDGVLCVSDTMLPTFTDPELPYDECVTTAFRSPTAAPLLLPVSTTSTVSLQDITDTVPREGVSATEMALFTLPKWLPVISMRLPVGDLASFM